MGTRTAIIDTWLCVIACCSVRPGDWRRQGSFHVLSWFRRYQVICETKSVDVGSSHPGWPLNDQVLVAEYAT